ncbi:hypothetical protein QYF36_025962 [Acer negundo]|nr:hypothetical protein QYF36_025962 [Acer negundo]
MTKPHLESFSTTFSFSPKRPSPSILGQQSPTMPTMTRRQLEVGDNVRVVDPRNRVLINLIHYIIQDKTVHNLNEFIESCAEESQQML